MQSSYLKVSRLSACLTMPACLMLICAVAPASLFAEITIMDEIVCKVNGDIITRSELEKDRKDLETAFREDQHLSGAKLTDAVNAELTHLLSKRIDDLLLEQKAKELDFKVDTEVNKQMGELQRRSKIADSDKFQAAIRDQTG